MSDRRSELGSYTFFRQQGHEPMPDDMHDGNPAFHLENVFGQNDDDPDPIHDTLGTNVDIVVRTDAEIFGNGTRRARAARNNPQQIDLADDWMKKNNHTW